MNEQESCVTFDCMVCFDFGKRHIESKISSALADGVYSRWWGGVSNIMCLCSSEGLSDQKQEFQLGFFNWGGCESHVSGMVHSHTPPGHVLHFSASLTP